METSDGLGEPSGQQIAACNRDEKIRQSGKTVIYSSPRAADKAQTQPSVIVGGEAMRLSSSSSSIQTSDGPDHQLLVGSFV